jgi:CheY-like chemotaxis protein
LDENNDDSVLAETSNHLGGHLAPGTPLILLVEDDENDMLFLELALERTGLPARLAVVRDGQEAIHYLAGEGAYAERWANPLPDLVLLDVKMPKLDGFDVLTWLRAQPRFLQLPVVILSSSAEIPDLERARILGADEYRVKPPDFERLVQIVQELHVRWLR